MSRREARGAFLGVVSVEAGSVETGSVETGSVETGSVETGSVETGSVETGSAETGSVEMGSAGFWLSAALPLLTPEVGGSCGRSAASSDDMVEGLIVLKDCRGFERGLESVKLERSVLIS